MTWPSSSAPMDPPPSLKISFHLSIILANLRKYLHISGESGQGLKDPFHFIDLRECEDVQCLDKCQCLPKILDVECKLTGQRELK